MERNPNWNLSNIEWKVDQYRNGNTLQIDTV